MGNIFVNWFIPLILPIVLIVVAILLPLLQRINQWSDTRMIGIICWLICGYVAVNLSLQVVTFNRIETKLDQLSSEKNIELIKSPKEVWRQAKSLLSAPGIHIMDTTSFKNSSEYERAINDAVNSGVSVTRIVCCSPDASLSDYISLPAKGVPDNLKIYHLLGESPGDLLVVNKEEGTQTALVGLKQKGQDGYAVGILISDPMSALHIKNWILDEFVERAKMHSSATDCKFCQQIRSKNFTANSN